MRERKRVLIQPFSGFRSLFRMRRFNREICLNLYHLDDEELLELGQLGHRALSKIHSQPYACFPRGRKPCADNSRLSGFFQRLEGEAEREGTHQPCCLQICQGQCDPINR